jgi:two-component system response regulator HydG
MADELVLLADDDPIGRDYLAEALAGLGVTVETYADGAEAIARLQRDPQPDLVVTDLQMPRRDGLAVLEASKAADPTRPVVLITAHGTMHVAVEAMRRGADDILEKPASPQDVELSLLRVRERAKLRRENSQWRARSVGEDMLVVSEPMRQLARTIERVAPSRATVLVTGESGVGKERVAARLHRLGERADGPFVTVNCAAIPASLMESEFFGHEAGAFTGASKRRAGCFELADGGTLFLDEVGEMDIALQAKLLRVLQEGEVTRVGGSRPIKVDVRVVAATNRDLRERVREGRFREDLLYRLDVVPLRVPPLRERRDDILPLAERFLGGRLELADCARSALQAHGWPGNVRELQNVMQRAVLMASGDRLTGADLDPWLGTPAPAGAAEGRVRAAFGDPDPIDDPVDGSDLVGRPLADIEREAILATLAACDGNRTRAAARLGIGVRTLFNKLKSYEGELVV